MDECVAIVKEVEEDESDAFQILRQFGCLYQGKVEELEARTDIDDVQRDKV